MYTIDIDKIDHFEAKDFANLYKIEKIVNLEVLMNNKKIIPIKLPDLRKQKYMLKYLYISYIYISYIYIYIYSATKEFISTSMFLRCLTIGNMLFTKEIIINIMKVNIFPYMQNLIKYRELKRAKV